GGLLHCMTGAFPRSSGSSHSLVICETASVLSKAVLLGLLVCIVRISIHRIEFNIRRAEYMIGIRIPTAASLLIFSSAAFAADLPVYTGQEPEPLPISQYFDWTGFYVGAHLGWGFGDQEFPAACECGAGSDAELDYDGLLGGLQIGYNYQFRPNWLVGIEGDIS